jgi:hypothetical protein
MKPYKTNSEEVDDLYRKLLTEVSRTDQAQNYIKESKGDYDWVQEKISMILIEDFDDIWDEVIKPLMPNKEK